MPEEKLVAGYSEYWRKNKSAEETKELAYALRALRKVGSYIATNIKNIEWGYVSGSNKNILIDPSFAMGYYPIPAGLMDILVGIAAHEAFHCKELSDWAWINTENGVEDLRPADKALLRMLVDAGEDIYIKQVARDSVWQNYINKAWGYCRPVENRDVSLPPTPGRLFRLWGDILLEGRVFKEIHNYYLEPLMMLVSSAEEIIKCREKSSVSKRSKTRSEIYLKLWKQLSAFFKEWELEYFSEPEGVGLIQDEKGRKETGEGTEEAGEAGPEREENDDPVKNKLNNLSEQINKILDEGREKTLTEEIGSIVGKDTAGMMETVFSDAYMPCTMTADPELVWRLKRTFDVQKIKKPVSHRVSKGLYYGKIDGRRLYKAPINGRIFKQKEPVYRNNAWNITILVDASASMRGSAGIAGKEWATAEKTFVSLYEAAKGSGNRLNVLGYFEAAGRCEVSRMLNKNRIFTLAPNGRTPTGQAIVAAALKTPKDKKRLLIHITDGEPNCGMNVDKAIDFCERDGIDLLTIGCYYNEEAKEQFQAQYKDKLYLMDSIEQLPYGLEAILRKKLLRQRI